MSHCLCRALCLVASLSCVLSDVQFPHSTQQCLEQQVEYQCTVTGTSPLTLIWTVYYSNGTQFGSPEAYSSSTMELGLKTIGDVFRVEQISSAMITPLVSNISFTVQSSIEGYTIVCSDGSVNNESLTIDISAGGPPPLLNISTNQTTILISWTHNSTQCITGYTVNTNTTNSIVNTTDTSVTIPLVGLSTGIYCVRVATIDTTNRTGEYSDKKCIELNVPTCLINVTTDTDSQSLNTDIKISWIFHQPIIPPLSAVYLSHNVTSNSERTVLQLPVNTTEYNITVMRVNVTYVFTVFGENAIGNGSICDYYTYIPNIIQPSPTAIPPPQSNQSSVSTTVIAIIIVIIGLILMLIILYFVSVLIRAFRGRKENLQNSKKKYEVEAKKTNEVEDTEVKGTKNEVKAKKKNEVLAKNEVEAKETNKVYKATKANEVKGTKSNEVKNTNEVEAKETNDVGAKKTNKAEVKNNKISISTAIQNVLKHDWVVIKGLHCKTVPTTPQLIEEIDLQGATPN